MKSRGRTVPPSARDRGPSTAGWPLLVVLAGGFVAVAAAWFGLSKSLGGDNNQRDYRYSEAVVGTPSRINPLFVFRIWLRRGKRALMAVPSPFIFAAMRAGTTKRRLLLQTSSLPTHSSVIRKCKATPIRRRSGATPPAPQPTKQRSPANCQNRLRRSLHMPQLESCRNTYSQAQKRAL